MFAAADIAQVIGQQYSVYGPLLRGAKTVLFEGSPFQTPDAGGYWRVIERTKVKHLYTFPSAIRGIKGMDSKCLNTSHI